ncbi:MAG: hypothetical protein H8K03_10820 [Nitrospira sp.]|jgi:hypothetical protein|nr:hypothetical protein [Nitrospira sp. BO4]
MPRRVSLASLALTLLTLAGCADPPTQQIQEAEKALKEAQQSGAAKYSADEYAKLEGTLDTLRKEVAEQDGKFALFRDYGKAQQLSVSAKADSDRIKAAAAQKKEEAKGAAMQAQQVAEEAVKATQDLVAKAPVGKDRAAVEAIKNDVEGLKSLLKQVQVSIDKEDYPAAQTQAKAIYDMSQGVSTEIQNALAKVGRGKPAHSKKK